MPFIYLVTCTVTGKYYVGKTLKDPITRWKGHVAGALSGVKKAHLANSIVKYGKENFVIETLSKCDSESLNNLEKLWIISLNANNSLVGMNVKTGGEGGKLADETKEKIRKARKGWKPSAETLYKMHLAGKKLLGDKNGFFGKTHSEETKALWSKDRKGSTPWNKGTRKVKAKYNDPEKQCSVCGSIKPQTEEFFYRASGKRSHTFSYKCKECTKSYVKAWKKFKTKKKETK